MEITHVKYDKASFVTFENIYTPSELDSIWKEATFLCEPRKFLDPMESGGAMGEFGTVLKQNYGVRLNTIYTSNHYSNYLSVYKKPIMALANRKFDDPLLKFFFQTNYDVTLMSYYEDGDYYGTHIDKFCYTFVFWLFREPRMFSGGDLNFPDFDHTIKIKSNCGVLFPSWLPHEVDKVSMPDTIEKYKSNGRFAFSTFYSIKD